MLPEYQNSTPYVGQVLDFYPNENARHAAICTEVFPTDGIERPKINLMSFTPDGEAIPYLAVSPAQISPEGQSILKECWGFLHEFAILQKADLLAEEEKGTVTNRHVGTLTLL